MLSPGTRCLYSAAKMHLDFIGKEDIIGNMCCTTTASYRADEGWRKTNVRRQRQKRTLTTC